MGGQGAGLGGQGRCDQRSEVFCENSKKIGGGGGSGRGVGLGGQGECERNFGGGGDVGMGDVNQE